MITMPISEGIAFDMYAIACIKDERTRNTRLDSPSAQMACDLGGALPDPMLWINVLRSAEYETLYAANVKVFDLIDEMHKHPKILAYGPAIDKANYERYLAKVALQKRWFPDTPIGEVKIGYDTPIASTP